MSASWRQAPRVAGFGAGSVEATVAGPHGALMSFWMLSVTIGNLWVLVVNAAVKNAAVTSAIASTGFGVTAVQMFFFAGFAFVAAFLNAAFAFCLGCQIWLGLRRLGVIRG